MTLQIVNPQHKFYREETIDFYVNWDQVWGSIKSAGLGQTHHQNIVLPSEHLFDGHGFFFIADGRLLSTEMPLYLNTGYMVLL